MALAAMIGHDHIMAYCHYLEDGWSHQMALKKAGIPHYHVKHITNPIFIAAMAKYKAKLKSNIILVGDRGTRAPVGAISQMTKIKHRGRKI